MLAGLVVFVAPSGHAAEDWDEVFAFVRKRIFGTWGYLGERLFSNDAIFLKGFKALAKRTRVNAADRLFELAKAFWAGIQITN